MSHIMRKLVFAYAKTKAAVKRLCFGHIDSTIYFLNFKPLDIFCGCTARFVSDLVGNPDDRFRRDAAKMSLVTKTSA